MVGAVDNIDHDPSSISAENQQGHVVKSSSTELQVWQRLYKLQL